MNVSLHVSLQAFSILSKLLLYILILFDTVSTFSPPHSGRVTTNRIHWRYSVPCHFFNRPNQLSDKEYVHTLSSVCLAARNRAININDVESSFLNNRRRCQQRYTSELKLFTTNIGATNTNDIEHSCLDSRRRKLLHRTIEVITGCGVIFSSPKYVEARGLVQFPCPNGLANSYHFLRVGTSLLEEEGIWSTNPLFLTNREDALSEIGIEQIIDASQQLSVGNRSPTVVKYSLAASCINTADIVQRELKLGRDRVIPEFTFLDPRAIGKWDMMSKTKIEPAVWALDHDQAGIDGLGGRPPENEDGTPNETLADQATRLRQLLSVLESQYSGDTILLIFPDGTGPALLSAMIAGIPYNRAHQLEFTPGEIRFDVTYQSTLKLWKDKQSISERNGVAKYDVILEQGRKTLPELLVADSELSGNNDFVNLKDVKIEKERLEVESMLESKEEERRSARAEADRVQKERQRYIAQNETSESLAISPAWSSIGGLVATAAVLSVATQNTTSSSDSKIFAIANETDQLLSNVGEKSPTTISINDAGVSRSPLYSRERVNGDFNASLPLPIPSADPRLAADRAMEEYMERDDGGEDWIRVMNEIIQEPDSDVDEFDEEVNTVRNASSYQ